MAALHFDNLTQAKSRLVNFPRNWVRVPRPHNASCVESWETRDGLVFADFETFGKGIVVILDLTPKGIVLEHDIRYGRV